MIGLGVVAAGVAAHAAASAVWARRESRAGQRIPLALLGEVPTRTARGGPPAPPPRVTTPPEVPAEPTSSAPTPSDRPGSSDSPGEEPQP